MDTFLTMEAYDDNLSSFGGVDCLLKNNDIDYESIDISEKSINNAGNALRYLTDIKTAIESRQTLSIEDIKLLKIAVPSIYNNAVDDDMKYSQAIYTEKNIAIEGIGDFIINIIKAVLGAITKIVTKIINFFKWLIRQFTGTEVEETVKKVDKVLSEVDHKEAMNIVNAVPKKDRLIDPDLCLLLSLDFNSPITYDDVKKSASITNSVCLTVLNYKLGLNKHAGLLYILSLEKKGIYATLSELGTGDIDALIKILVDSIDTNINKEVYSNFTDPKKKLEQVAEKLKETGDSTFPGECYVSDYIAGRQFIIFIPYAINDYTTSFNLCMYTPSTNSIKNGKNVVNCTGTIDEIRSMGTDLVKVQEEYISTINEIKESTDRIVGNLNRLHEAITHQLHSVGDFSTSDTDNFAIRIEAINLFIAHTNFCLSSIGKSMIVEKTILDAFANYKKYVDSTMTIIERILKDNDSKIK